MLVPFAVFELLELEATVLVFEFELGVGSDCRSGPLFVELSVLSLHAGNAKTARINKARSLFIFIRDLFLASVREAAAANEQSFGSYNFRQPTVNTVYN